jgi:hypothetical protein
MNKFKLWLDAAIILFLLILLSPKTWAALTDIQFGRYQIADSQWNVSACLNTTTCQIYSKNPGVMYKIPWTSGQWSWQAGQYVKFSLSGNASFPYEGKVYNSDGSVAGTIGLGKIVNMGPDYFFFVGSDNDTGQLFSGSSGMNNTAGVSWTGTLNPTTAQANTYADANYSTVPLSQGQTATQTPSNSTPSPVPTAIYNNSSNVWITNHYPTSNNSPAGEGAANAFDNNPYTKYLNFDKYNAGVTVKLNEGRIVTGFTLTTANDFPGRDPTSYKLYGSNNGTTWTLIQDGNLNLSDSRYNTSAMITVTNSTSYIYYYIFFPTTKAGDGCGLNCDSMQIAEITFYYDYNNATTSADAGSGSVSNPGSFCCGGTNAPFNADTQFTNRVTTFQNRPLQDTKVIITQIGNNNSATVIQSGTKNNYSEIYVSGSNNTTNTTQTSTSASATNYIELDVIGSSNTVNLTQSSTGGTKGIMATIDNTANSLTINQSGSGNHYSEINLSGGNKTVNLTQSGSAAHMANITLSGGTTSITTSQSGSTQQHYSINYNCAQISCAAITVTQGQ